MFFKDLKPGFSIFIYDQSTIVVKSAKVVNVSTPHLDSNIQRTPIGSSPMSMVVDLTIDQDGVNKTYTIPDTSETAYAGSVVISTERANILREVEATKTKFEQHLSQVPDIKAGLTKCNDILVEFNPAYKEKKETEERFSNIENNVNDLKGMMSEILRELKGTK
jgi:hypothetical protein